MFTGITTGIGTVTKATQRGDLRLVICCNYEMDTVAIGASIACSGVCLTVAEKGEDWFAVDASAETISCTAPDMWKEGRKLNLERALKVGDELGGHIVTGHIDGVGKVQAYKGEGDSHRLTISVSSDIAPFVAAKGSITIDGVSLTVNSVADNEGITGISLNIIPHTASVTTLGELTTGQEVNLEIDVLARYLKRMEDMRGS
ncbi:MAG: riboflavin synthase [Sphingorhabdus sp.]